LIVLLKGQELMAQVTQLSMQALQNSELAPIVSQVIDNPDIDFLDWQVHPVSGVGGSQMGGGLGVFRLVGSAKAASQVYSWSVIVKVVSGSKSTGDPNDTSHILSAWNYWKREILAYRSGILSQLSGNLVAPRCYGITQHPNDEWRIWLEDIQESPKTWTLEHHGLAARHLGEFNGLYLAGHGLPEEQPWLYQGRAHDWPAFAAPMFEGFQQYARSASGQQWLTEHSVARMERLLARRQALLALLDKLPVCLCHHDAFRRNLMRREGLTAEAKTVAIDWSMIGYGGVGEEIGITTAVGLSFLEVPADQASQMDQVTFNSYVVGLRAAGWQGDVRLARFGYTTTASLVTGVAWAMILGVLVLSTEEGIRSIESTLGYKLDDILAQWAIIQPFLLDLGDEALDLMDELG
jgi:phosphotransferase family enzyme